MEGGEGMEQLSRRAYETMDTDEKQRRVEALEKKKKGGKCRWASK